MAAPVPEIMDTTWILPENGSEMLHQFIYYKILFYC
jgi:hypothetical protein